MADNDPASAQDATIVEVFETSEGGYQKTVVEVDSAKPVKLDSDALSGVSSKSEGDPEGRPEPDVILGAAGPQPDARPEFIKPVLKTKSPPSTPAKKKKKAIPQDAEGQGKIIAESMVDGFVDVIRARAAKRGGHLLPEDIDALSKSFEEQTHKLAASLSRTISMMAEAHSKAQWDPERVNVFDRVLVKQFSHLLGDDEKAIQDPEIVSRRALAGLFAAIRMMCGPARVEQLEQDAYLVMQRVRDDMKDDFEWETVYDDPRTKHMIRDLSVDIAPHFIELDKRMDWLLSVVNGNLTPPSAPHATGADWVLSEQGLFVLLEALFEEIFQTIESDMGRLRVTKRYGVDTLDLVLELKDVFEQHRKHADLL